MMEPLFDRSREYDSMLNNGLRVSGETKEYFIHGRVKDLAKTLPPGFNVARVLDFGCGIGDTTFILRQYFPDAEITGADLSTEALRYAAKKYSGAFINFVNISDIPDNCFDVAYANGVFHHIEPPKRTEAARMVYRSLRNRGYFALYENNPWNPGSRIVMSRIKFDREAKPLSHMHARAVLRGGGFEEIICSRFLFYFPRFLSAFRPVEKFLVGFPLGAQYYTLARKNSAPDAVHGS